MPFLNFLSSHLLPSSSAGEKDYSKKADLPVTLSKSQTDVALLWISFPWLSGAFLLSGSVWGAYSHWMVFLNDLPKTAFISRLPMCQFERESA